MGELDRVAAEFDREIERVRETQAGGAVRTSRPGLKRETVGRILTRAGRGASDPAAALLAWERDFEITGAVAILRNDGDSEVAAVERVAAGTEGVGVSLLYTQDTVRPRPSSTPRVSVDVVRRAVRRVRRLLPDDEG